MGRKVQAWKSFERNIAKVFSLWWFGDEKSLVRSPCSGGWPGKRAEGDIIAVSEEGEKDFIFCVDAKQRIAGDIECLLSYKKHPIIIWWEELLEMKPVKEGKVPLLVISKFGLKSSHVIVSFKDFQWMAVCGLNVVHRFIFSRGWAGDKKEAPEKLVIIRLSDFLDYLVPSRVKMEIKKSEERLEAENKNMG